MLYQQLNIQPGVTAIIGSGGKTSTMLALAAQLPGTVVVCTTTHIKAPEEMPLYTGANCADAAELLRKHRVICVGSYTDEGKLTASPIPMADLAQTADYVLVEADGSKRLPLKAHLSHEPVIPQEAVCRIMLVGVSAFGKPVQEVAHRLERFCELAQMQPEEFVQPLHAARVIQAEALCDLVLVNQVETETDLQLAKELAACLPQYPVFAAAVRNNRCQKIQ